MTKMSEVVEVFGYGIAHKWTGKRLVSTGRKVYDSRGAASGALSRAKKVYDPVYQRDQNPEEFEVVALVPHYD